MVEAPPTTEPPWGAANTEETVIKLNKVAAIATRNRR